MPACRYLEGNGLAAMLATKRLAGVTPEVDLREHVHICFWQAQISLPTLSGFGTIGDITRSPQQGVSGPTKRTQVLKKKFFLNNVNISCSKLFSGGSSMFALWLTQVWTRLSIAVI